MATIAPRIISVRQAYTYDVRIAVEMRQRMVLTGVMGHDNYAQEQQRHSLQLGKIPLPHLEDVSYQSSRHVLELGEISLPHLEDDSRQSSRCVLQLGPIPLPHLEDDSPRRSRHVLELGKISLPHLKDTSDHDARCVLQLSALTAAWHMQVEYWYNPAPRYAIQLGARMVARHSLSAAGSGREARHALKLGAIALPHLRHNASYSLRSAQRMPYQLKYTGILTQPPFVVRYALKLGKVLAVHALQQKDDQRSVQMGAVQSARHALRQKPGQLSMQMGAQPRVVYHGNYAWQDADGTVRLPLPRSGVMRLGTPVGHRVLQDDSPQHVRCAALLSDAPHSPPLEVRSAFTSAMRHALRLGAPEMQRRLHVPHTAREARHALHLPAPSVHVAPAPQVVYEHSWFPLQGLPVMPWGPTLVQGIIDCARMIVPDTGTGDWALWPDAQWTHDSFEGDLAGVGVWQVLQSQDDGSASGTFSGAGTWGAAGPLERTYFDEGFQEVVQSSIGYSGGIWGGTGTWSVSATGALSWTFAITKGNGWRLERITRIGTSPADIVRGEGIPRDFDITGDGASGGGGFRSLIADWHVPKNADGSTKTPEQAQEWFLNLLQTSGGGASAADAQAQEEKEKGTHHGESKNDGDRSTGDDSPPVMPPPDNSGDFEGAPGNPSSPPKQIVFSSGAQLVGPVPSLLLANATGSRGAVQSSAPQQAVHSLAHAVGRTGARSGAHGALASRAHARDALHAASAQGARGAGRALGAAYAGARSGALHDAVHARSTLHASRYSWQGLHSAAHARDALALYGVGSASGSARGQGAAHAIGASAAYALAHAVGTAHARSTQPLQGIVARAHARGTAGAWQHTHAALVSRARAHASVHAPDAHAVCWAMTLPTHAVYFWQHWPFRDMVQIGEHIFAASNEGLALVGTADDDAGTPIDASMTYGFSALGGFADNGAAIDNDCKKRVPSVYVGYTAKGILQLLCETYGQGLPVFKYRMPAAPAEQPMNNRITIGKGLNARYWRLGVQNYQGCQFSLHALTADVLVSKRRI